MRSSKLIRPPLSGNKLALHLAARILEARARRGTVMISAEMACELATLCRRQLEALADPRAA